MELLYRNSQNLLTNIILNRIIKIGLKSSVNDSIKNI